MICIEKKARKAAVKVKKLVALVLMVAALLGVAVTANAVVEVQYVTQYEVIKGADWDDRQNAPTIQVGVAYKTNDYEKFYKFCPEKTGIYTISLTESKSATRQGTGRFIDSDGNQVGDRCTCYENSKVSLNANKIYRKLQ